jgi:hypothetical protein
MSLSNENSDHEKQRSVDKVSSCSSLSNKYGEDDQKPIISLAEILSNCKTNILIKSSSDCPAEIFSDVKSWLNSHSKIYLKNFNRPQSNSGITINYCGSFFNFWNKIGQFTKHLGNNGNFRFNFIGESNSFLNDYKDFQLSTRIFGVKISLIF